MVGSQLFHYKCRVKPALLLTIVAGLVLATYAQNINIRRSPDMAQPRTPSAHDRALLDVAVSKAALSLRSRLLHDSAVMLSWQHLVAQLPANGYNCMIATGDAVGTTITKKFMGDVEDRQSQHKWHFRIPRIARGATCRAGNIIVPYAQTSKIQGLILCFIFAALVGCRLRLTYNTVWHPERK